MKRKRENGVWSVGELAAAAGVSTDSLRHYERKALLKPKRLSNGYREYPEHALERVQLIRQALAIGFTLDELAAVFSVFDHGGAPCHKVRELAALKLAQVEQHLQEVTELRDELREALADWDARLSQTARGQRANLLKTLATRQNVQRVSPNLLLRRSEPRKKGKKNE